MKPLLLVLTVGGNISKLSGVYPPLDRVSPLARYCAGAFAVEATSGGLLFIRDHYSGVRQLTIALEESDNLTAAHVAALHNEIESHLNNVKDNVAILVATGSNKIQELFAYLREPEEFPWSPDTDIFRAGVTTRVEDGTMTHLGPSGYRHAAHLARVPIVLVGTDEEIFMGSGYINFKSGAIPVIDWAIKLLTEDSSGRIQAIWQSEP